jgi:hypothetical protein
VRHTSSASIKIHFAFSLPSSAGIWIEPAELPAEITASDAPFGRHGCAPRRRLVESEIGSAGGGWGSRSWRQHRDAREADWRAFETRPSIGRPARPPLARARPLNHLRQIGAPGVARVGNAGDALARAVGVEPFEDRAVAAMLVNQPVQGIATESPALRAFDPYRA